MKTAKLEDKMSYQNVLKQNQKDLEDQLGPVPKKILSSARKLFLENGYGATTVREIAHDSGITLGLITYYFKSKESIAEHVFRSIVAEYFEKFNDLDLSDLSNAEQMYVTTYFFWKISEGNLNFSRFFYERMKLPYMPSHITKQFRNYSNLVIEDYKKNISKEDQDFYIVTLIGMEAMIKINTYEGVINRSYEQITNLIISDYLFNIGLSDKEIAKIITNSEVFIKAHPVFFDQIN